MIDAAELRSRFTYDPLTGENNFPRKIGGAPVKASRLAWLHFYGAWPKRELCFVDGDTRNIAIDNLVLRPLDRVPVKTGDRVHYERVGARPKSKTGVVGVSPSSNGGFRVDAFGKHVGTTSVLAEAKQMYQGAVKATIRKRAGLK